MRSLQIISPSGPYGAEKMMLNLMVGLQKTGNEPIAAIVQNSHNPQPEVLKLARRLGVPAVGIGCNGKLDFGLLKQLMRCIKEYHVDIIHSHGFKTNVYGLLAARATGIPIVTTYHSGSSAWRQALRARLYRALEIRLLPRFSKIISVSEPIRDMLRQNGIAENRLACINNGLDVQSFSTATPAPEIRQVGRPVVAFVGRLVPEKGPDVFLRAARKVLLEIPGAGFIVVGSGPCRGLLESLATGLGISGRVFFAGIRDDMPSVYAAVDMVVLPSIGEGLPMTILEALATKRAVISTPVGAIPTVVLHGETGLLVHPGDAEALAEAIVRLGTSPELAAKLGNNGHDLVDAKFSADLMSKQYLALYAEVLSTRRRATTPCATQATRPTIAK
jgi:glycosyltransferase involved in cell wall biosynthesis